MLWGAGVELRLRPVYFVQRIMFISCLYIVAFRWNFMGSNIHREENKNVDFISMSEYLSQNVPIDYVRRLKVDTERLYLFLKESNSRQSEARKSKTTKRQQLEDAAQRKPLEVANDPMTYTCWIGYIERLSKVHCFNRPDRRTRNNAQSSKNQINVSAFQHNHPPI